MPKSVEFDAQGRTVGDGETVDEVVEETEEETEEELPEGDEAELEGTEGDPPPAKPEGKYRIGDKFFKTEAEALAYANSKEQETNAIDAYRQGVRDAAAVANPPESVTPAPTEDSDFDEDAYYADPGKYMRERDARIIAKAAEAINNQAAIKDAGNAIWNEFTGRHPDLAEFRAETESFVERNKTDIQDMIKVKGRPAAYDYIAMKMKSDFRRYERALKPTKELPNGGGGPSPTGSRTSVTLKVKTEKVLTFSQQLALNRKVR